MKMKLTSDQWNRIIQAIVTAVVTICNIILVSSCAVTMSMSVQKNNSSSTQQIEQKSESRNDSTTLDLSPNF
ncbi:hypothetical protein F3D71_08895 [Bacteroides ovatus]|jgi:hypothetical protein|uniref:Uncharacterized protein n=2 Tax=Bacteroides TaxID=816 RepID=A0A5M5C449_BACOV|nr:hypothetical protein F3D71_08895 [Bacteroides ovatus]